MSFSVNTNVTSLQAQNNLRASSDFQSKTINRVTSGLRIVNSGDDAAGLAIANGFRSDQAVLGQGIRNANDGLSTLQTIDGGMNNISLLLDRARTLATQSASGTFAGGTDGRTTLNSEFQSVITEISRQAQAVGMNTGGQFAKALSVFIGGGKDASGLSNNTASISNGSISVDLSQSAVDSKALGLTTFQTAAPTTAPTLSTITAGTTGGNVDLKFFGAGFESGVTVTANNVSSATSLNDVVADINTAINTAATAAGGPAAAFKAAGIVATTDGKSIQFQAANAAFSVSDGTNGTAAARNILGTAGAGVQVGAQGDKQVTLDYGTALGAGESQLMTISMTDSTGKLISTSVNMGAAGATTKAQQVTAINTALKAANNDLSKLVAVDQDASATGSLVIMGGSNFKVYVGAGTGGDGLTVHGGTTQSSFVDSAANGTGGAVDILNQTDAQQAVNALANAVSTLGSAQAAVGKGENNFNYAMNLAQSQTTNLAAAESRIRDADLASEAANLTKAQILIQAGTAALAQANSAPQAILSLLKG